MTVYLLSAGLVLFQAIAIPMQLCIFIGRGLINSIVATGLSAGIYINVIHDYTAFDSNDQIKLQLSTHEYTHIFKDVILPLILAQSNQNKMAMKLTCKWMYMRVNVNSYPRYRRARTFYVDIKCSRNWLVDGWPDLSGYSVNIPHSCDGDMLVVNYLGTGTTYSYYIVKNTIKQHVDILLDTSIVGYYTNTKTVRYWTKLKAYRNQINKGMNGRTVIIKTQYGDTLISHIIQPLIWHELSLQSTSIRNNGEIDGEFSNGISNGVQCPRMSKPVYNTLFQLEDTCMQLPDCMMLS